MATLQEAAIMEEEPPVAATDRGMAAGEAMGRETVALQVPATTAEEAMDQGVVQTQEVQIPETVPTTAQAPEKEAERTTVRATQLA
jgi:hypothetical protein